MVLIRFTKLLPKLYAGIKKQTIRKPRKIVRKDGVPPITEGSKLNVYALMEVGTATVTKITRKALWTITEEEAIKDGFNTKIECIDTIKEMHKVDDYLDFDVIEYEPDWMPFYIIDRLTLRQLEHLCTERDLYLTEKNIPAIYTKNQQLQKILRKIKTLKTTVTQ